MPGLNFQIAATLDAAGFKGAAEALRTVEDASGGVTTALEATAGAFETVESAIQGFLAIQVIQFLRDIVNQTIEHDKAEQQLKLAVDNTGQSYEANKSKISGYLAATQSLTGANKEELVPALEVLISRLGSVRQAQDQLNLVIGVSRGLNMDYAAAAALVSGVVNGQPRALNEAARAMGLDTAAKKDASVVLKDLTQRYGDFADKESALTKTTEDFSNQWTYMKELLGTYIAPIFVMIGDVALRVLNSIIPLTQTLALVIGYVGTAIAKGILYPLSFISPAFKDAYNSVSNVLTAMREEANKTGAEMQQALFGNNSGNAAAQLKRNLVDPHQAAYLQMNETELKALAAGDLAAATSAKAQLQYKIAQLQQEAEAQKQALKDQDNYSRLSAQNREALMTAVDNETNQKRLALQRQFDSQQAAEDKKYMDSQIALTRTGTEENLKLRLQELDAETAAQKRQIAESIMAEQDRAKAIATIDNNAKAQRIKIYTETYAQETSMAEQAATAIGTSTGNMLAGQQDAWKSALTAIIQMVFNTAAKNIMANYATGASSYVAEGGYWGIALGAGLMALGAAAAAAVSSASTSPTSSSLPGGTVSTAAPSATSSPLTGPQAAGPISISIQGDVIGDNAFVDRMAQKLSAAVNNRDVRLVATQLSS